ncbi:MAG: hypothetical protein LBV60_15790 [Streptomyces sp.]|nr:hypothetical protein [Streptomyces sp.]
MRDVGGEALIRQQRWRCRSCGKVVTVFHELVVPRFLYSRAVIAGGLQRRQEGATWERAAAACTTDGQLDPCTLRRWSRCFQLEQGWRLVGIPPPVMHFPALAAAAMLGTPAGSRSPNRSPEDPWARSPPQP